MTSWCIVAKCLTRLQEVKSRTFLGHNVMWFALANCCQARLYGLSEQHPCERSHSGCRIIGRQAVRRVFFKVMEMIEFTIEGTPRPQGSKRNVGGGIMVESSKHVKEWRAFARMKAVEAMRGLPRIEKPTGVSLAVRFYFDRPKKHFTSKGLRPEAPLVHVGKPDTDKILRALFDSMTEIVFEDDSQICRLTVSKLYGKFAETIVSVGACE